MQSQASTKIIFNTINQELNNPNLSLGHLENLQLSPSDPTE